MNSNYQTREVIVRETLYPFGATVKEVVGELVRCKDCKWRETACTIFTPDNWFCPKGERQEE